MDTSTIEPCGYRDLPTAIISLVTASIEDTIESTVRYSVFAEILTCVGNVLIIAAVMTTRRLRTVTNCFVMSLAVADWLVGIFVMPMAVAVHIKGKWIYGQVLCLIWVSSDVCLCTASILSLCAISIDRYFAVTQPIKYTRRRRSRRLALLMILFVWLLSIAITCPPLWYNKFTPNEDCDYSRDKGYVIFSAMGSFFVPLIVMVYVYVKIYRVISQRHDNLESLSAGRPHVRWPLDTVKLKRKTGNLQDESDLEKGSSESEEVITSMVSHQPASDRFSYNISRASASSFKRESKTAQTLSVVVGGFIACWLPFFVVYLITPFLPNESIPVVASKLLTWLGWVNSAINPFIYAFYSPDFRVAFWRLTMKRFCGQNVCRPLGYNSRQSVQMRASGIFTTNHRP